MIAVVRSPRVSAGILQPGGRTMKGITLEATVRDGRIVLPEGACIADNTRVYVVVPESKDA